MVAARWPKFEDIPFAVFAGRMAERFRKADTVNHERMEAKDRARYQQVFFPGRDDVDLEVKDV